MWQRLNTWAAVMWELRLPIGEPRQAADVLRVISARPPGCRIMTDLPPRSAHELVIREAPSQHDGPHLTPHEGGKARTGRRNEETEPPERLRARRWLSPVFATSQKCQILTDYLPSGNINYKTAPWAPLGLMKIHRPQLKPGWKNVLLCSEKQQLNLLAAVYQKENSYKI